MDLARAILLAVEARDEIDQRDFPVEVPGYQYEQIVYHVQLLDESGLLVAHDWSSHDGKDWRVERLTWDGHEFLDAAREDNRWEAAKQTVKAKAGEASFEVIKAVLVNLAMRAVGLSSP